MAASGSTAASTSTVGNFNYDVLRTFRSYFYRRRHSHGLRTFLVEQELQGGTSAFQIEGIGVENFKQ
jgi:hypothetical protein